MPSGVRLKDGFPTLITLGTGLMAPDTIGLWEMTVKPPGFDSGGPNDTTTMRNRLLRTRQPKKLITMTNSTGKCAYDPAILEQVLTIVGKNHQIIYTFPDSSKWTFWGWLDKFEPDEIREGAQPEASYTIEPSNEDNAGAEQPPIYTPPTTTTSHTTP